MARLTEGEKEAIRELAAGGFRAPVREADLSPEGIRRWLEENAAYADWYRAIGLPEKPVRFVGDQWKL
jgi:hypothetical protein